MPDDPQNAPAIRKMRIPEHVVPGKRLGRNLHHDPASRAYAVTRRAAPIASRHWTRHVPIYDQGSVGDCTSEAICGALSTGPFRHRIRSQRTMLAVYHDETLIDGFGDPFPPNDRGSSGLAACKVAQRRGWITGYRHCFGLDDVLAALQDGPVLAGVSWWSSFDQPASDGTCPLTPNAYIRGGHEVCLVGLDVANRTIRFANSWGPTFGVKGYGMWTYDTLTRLLADNGDATVPTPT